MVSISYTFWLFYFHLCNITTKTITELFYYIQVPSQPEWVKDNEESAHIERAASERSGARDSGSSADGDAASWPLGGRCDAAVCERGGGATGATARPDTAAPTHQDRRLRPVVTLLVLYSYRDKTVWCVTGPTRDVARHRITYTVQAIILNEVLSLPIPLAHTRALYE